MAFPHLFRDDVFHLETARLWLRWPRASDALALHEVTAAAEVAEMTASWPHPLPAGEVERRILHMREACAAGTGLDLVMVRKRRVDRAIGVIMLTARDERALELGYLLGPPHQARGYMTEAVCAVVRVIFTATLFDRIDASSRIDNAGSRRVLEKAGFAPARRTAMPAPARGGSVEVAQFCLRREDWKQIGCPAGWDRDGGKRLAEDHHDVLA